MELRRVLFRSLARGERQAKRAGVGDAGRNDGAGIIDRIDLQRLTAAIHHEAFAVDAERAVAGETHVGGAGRRLHHKEAFARSEEHTSELQSLLRISYAVFRLTKKIHNE